MEELQPVLTDEFAAYMRGWSKRYLQRVRGCAHTVAMICSEIAELESAMDGLGAVDYSRDRVSAPADDEGLLRRVERMASLRAEYADELERNLQWQADAHRALSHVRQPWRAVLTYRSLEGKAWDNVADAVRYSADHCKADLHESGLLELYPHIPHEYDELPGAI